jgi:glycosyltransferase involved in cell wall biosynthesis
VPYSALVERRVLRSAACLRALTDTEAEDYRRFGLRNPIAVIPNGVDTTWAGNSGLHKERFPQVGERPTLLYIGRIHPKKGIFDLLRAWRGCKLQRAGWNLSVAGPDSQGNLKLFHSMVEALKLQDCVSYLGMLNGSDKWDALDHCSGFILPSYSEGFSMAILEAMSSSRPVLITPACNFPAVVSSGAGLCHAAGVPGTLDMLDEFFGFSASERKVMGMKGRDLVQSGYSWDAIGARMAELYESILNNNRPSGGWYQSAL